MTAFQHEEHGLGILCDNVGAPDIEVLAVQAEGADARILAPAIAVGPQPGAAGSEHRNPAITRRSRIGHVRLESMADTNERHKVAIACRCSRFAIHGFEAIGNEGTAFGGNLLESPTMLLVEIIA